MKKIIFMALFLAALLITPVWAQTDEKCVGGAPGEKCSQTGTSTIELITNLRAQIARLTAQLNQLLADQRKSFCYRFDRDFRGDDVSNPDWTKLGQVLRIEGVSSVKELQEKYADDVLRPSGLRLGTGYVGPKTRELLNRLYKCPVADSQAPVISGISGPTSLKVGETGTWTINAKDPMNGILSYMIYWGDEPMVVGPNSSGANPSSLTNSATFSHSYSAAGLYRIYAQVYSPASKLGNSAVVTVNVVNSNQSPITVLSPNGGEEWIAGSTQDIKWKWGGAKRTDKVDLYLDQQNPCVAVPGTVCAAWAMKEIIIDKNISARATAYHWLVASEIDSNEITIPAGQYRVRVCQAGTQVCDSSDQLLSINLPLINDAL